MNAQFVYTAGNYREYRGYVFANGRPVTIRDEATLKALREMPDFKEITDGKKEEAPAPAAQVLTFSWVKNICSKCGKDVNRGKYFHQKACWK